MTDARPHRRGRGAGRRALAAGAVMVAAVAWWQPWQAGSSTTDGAHPQRVAGDGTVATVATVTMVVDGDTIRAEYAHGTDLGRVRLLGIDAPELARDGRPAQCWSRQATTAAARLVAGRRVTLTADPTQADRDVYGRLLRYVTVDGTDVGTALIAEGAARYYVYGHTPTRRADVYRHAQTGAQHAGRGLWKACR